MCGLISVEISEFVCSDENTEELEKDVQNEFQKLSVLATFQIFALEMTLLLDFKFNFISSLKNLSVSNYFVLILYCIIAFQLI